MSLLKIRKTVIQLEETNVDMGKEINPAARKVSVAAIINNPFAGKYIEDLEPLYDLGAEVGGFLAERGARIG